MRWQRPHSSHSIIANTKMKGAKYLDLISINQTRSYSTRNKLDKTVIVRLQEEHSKEFESLVKH